MTVAAVVAALVLAGAQMGLFSGTRPEGLGVSDGRLAPVATHKQNAVSSFVASGYHRIAPLAAGPDPKATFARLVELVRATPRTTIVRQDDGYLYAEFTTRLMGYVDDVEFLLDAPARVIHVRSASRLGRKDFGVNRERIEALRAQLGLEPAGGAPGADAGGPAAAAAASTAPAPAGAPSTSSNGTSMTFQTTPSGLQYQDLVVGSGAEAKPGSYVLVHYTGWLYENGAAGRKFDSSKDRGDPFSFPLGAGHVIRGWDEGVAGMKIGGKRHLVIPPDLGYGARGAGGVIPPNATLLFEVELLGV